jgi:hypothetical protein
MRAIRLMTSMIIDDFDELGAAIAPFEANPPLVVDANAVLTATNALQCFQPIARRSAQIAQLRGGVDHVKLAAGHVCNRSEPRHGFAAEKCLGAPISEGPVTVWKYHASRYMPIVRCDGNYPSRIGYCVAAGLTVAGVKD